MGVVMVADVSSKPAVITGAESRFLMLTQSSVYPRLCVYASTCLSVPNYQVRIESSWHGQTTRASPLNRTSSQNQRGNISVVIDEIRRRNRALSTVDAGQAPL